jgi:epoxyqueuosine reductase QueG
VISWILPQTENTKADNRDQDRMPAERWARARIFGEKVNERLRRHVVDRLSAAGFRAVAPVLLAAFDSDHRGAYGRASTWSERHTAHAAGLGTFGLCDGMITPVGKAMRTGSVVVEARIPPTERTYGDHLAHCLFFSRGGCMVCAERCPVGAISEEGHDKEICRRHVSATNDYVREHYGFDGFGCGLCQTDVPCESGIPDL